MEYEGISAKTSLTVTGNSGAVPPGYAYIVAYFPSQGVAGVMQYLIHRDGSLSPISVYALLAGTQLRAILSDLTGRYVYVVESNASVLQFEVGVGGALQALWPAVVTPSMPGHSSFAVAAVHPTRNFLYLVVNADQELQVAQYAIAADGTLSALAPATVNLGAFSYYSSSVASPPSSCCYQTPSPWPYGDSVAFAPDGGHGFIEATSADGVQLIRLDIGKDGTLSSSVFAPPRPGTFVLSPDGHSAYVLSGTQLMSFSLDTNGKFTQTATFEPGFRPSVPTGLIFARQSAYLTTYFTDTQKGLEGPFINTRSPAPERSHSRAATKSMAERRLPQFRTALTCTF
ncbi:MAG: hypothetical protein JOZ03_14875 [Gammaproteobacteria bacterium]|nr:hypothetical protein [Gammaproteobacteria bacterium]